MELVDLAQLTPELESELCGDEPNPPDPSFFHPGGPSRDATEIVG